MVAMGGGPELPLPAGENERELLLCVLPWPENASRTVIEEIKREFPKYEVQYIQEQRKMDDGTRPKTEVPEELYKRVSILVTIAWLPPNASSVPSIKLIHFFSAGTNHIAQHPIYKDSDITLTSSSGIHGPQISEWVIMMNLVHAHDYLPLYELQKKREWRPYHPGAVRDMVRQKVGILGYGSIGRQVARVAKAMGMDVIAYTASPRPTPESRRDDGFIVPGTGDPAGEFPSTWYHGLAKEELHDFLRQNIDLLVLSVPLTKDTTHLLSTAEFELLQQSNPHGTLVANISRGGVIDQPALIKALETKQIRGAALDVTDPEPLPKDDPLWEAPNCTITPHLSGATTVYAQRAMQVLQENLRRLRDGRKLCNVIDRKRGY